MRKNLKQAHRAIDKVFASETYKQYIELITTLHLDQEYQRMIEITNNTQQFTKEEIDEAKLILIAKTKDVRKLGKQIDYVIKEILSDLGES